MHHLKLSKLQKTCQRKNLKIDYLNTDIESFNYKEKFDAVICFELIEHVPDPNELIRQIRNILSLTEIISINNKSKFIFIYVCEISCRIFT